MLARYAQFETLRDAPGALDEVRLGFGRTHLPGGGHHRLTFFCDNRRLRIVANERGDVVQHSVIYFGDHPLPASARRPGG